ncbi:hypothetical protein O181_025342 [Austropuccinia psidii MF-1]|uniref:Integrase zinc-binding domain-containing protein n=1 Tax=Austropuccinia psidii MF-1 TaxID=1389203 RepID=A0A9Q3CNC0_9BASI|nr:hypothetical protein [Austropuccinia psidii MF-1]
MKISLKKCHFAYSELKALGHVVSGLSLGIDKNKVAAVLLKPMPQTKKEMQSFLGFAGYYRQHIKDFASIAKSLCRWALANTHDNPAWVAQEEHHIEGICVTEIGTEFFNQVKERYKLDQNCHILSQLLIKDCKDPSLSSKLDETWKKAYDEGRFHLLDGILYHRTKHTCVMALTERTLISIILHECHDSVAAGHLSEDQTLERVKTCSWWPNWKKDVTEYCQTCDRCQNTNRATGKKFGMMIQIQEPKSP